MKKMGIAALVAAAALAQTKLTFEVATIKQSAPLDMAKMAAAMQSGQQMPIGPRVAANRAEYLYMNLKSLIVYAYQVKPYQVTGPEWLDQDRFDIVAKYPEGATKADAPQMLKALLEERFGLKTHKSVDELPVWALVAPGGTTKLKRSTEKPAPIDDNAPLKPGERKIDGPEGKPMLVRTDMAAGGAVVDMGEEGRMTYKFDSKATPPQLHIDFSMVTMKGFANMTTQLLSQLGGGAGGRQIVDMTGIQGNYEAQLNLSLEEIMALARSAGFDIPGGPQGGGQQQSASDPGAGGMSLGEAVRSMGLKLESRKAPVERLIVDHAERKPIEN